MEPSLSTQEPDFVVEWQIPEEPGELIDLAADRAEGEVLLLQEHRFAL
jgi:hypothetical protein